MSSAAEQQALRSIAGKKTKTDQTTQSESELAQVWHAPIPSDPKGLLKAAAAKLPVDLDVDAVF